MLAPGFVSLGIEAPVRLSCHLANLEDGLPLYGPKVAKPQISAK